MRDNILSDNLFHASIVYIAAKNLAAKSGTINCPTVLVPNYRNVNTPLSANKIGVMA